MISWIKNREGTMNLKFEVIPVETDVLVIGGGLAGCMAAIKARESGVNVTIAEKSNTLRSGCAGVGIDHIWAYIPPVHSKIGWTIEDLMEDHAEVMAHNFIFKDLLYLVASSSYDRILDLERFGLNFRYEDSNIPGKFRIVNQFHSMPSSFNFDGRDIKVKLTEEAKKRRVNIMNRTMVTDLLFGDGHISGALGVGTQTGDLYFFKAKTVVLSTGRANRLTRNLTGVDFNLPLPPHLTGDGKAMALRAGLEIINMEFIESRYLGQGVNQPSGGAPRGTYQPAGSVVDANGKVITPRTSFYDWGNLGKKKVDPIEARREFAEKRARGHFMFRLFDMHNGGEGPFYLDLTNGTEEEIKHIEWSMSNEGKCWLLLSHFREEGIDLRRDKIEYMGASVRDMRGPSAAGILVNGDLETKIKGLFAAGDEVGGFPWSCAPGALTMGWYAGDRAAQYALKQNSFLPVGGDSLDSLMESCSKMLTIREGDHWKEVELAVQNIMDFYCGDVTSGPLLRRGIDRLDEIKKDIKLKAANGHELWRCLELKSIITNIDTAMTASLERKESRKYPVLFNRVDFPEQDDKNYYAFLAIKCENGKFKCSKIFIQR